MLRGNHYERAFEHYLRERRLPYVAVDETRRALAADNSLKSLDFLVRSPTGAMWLVDVKGRSRASSRRVGENWVTADDLDSLARWEEVFGPRSRGLIVFAYQVPESAADELPVDVNFEGSGYAFYGVWARDYGLQGRSRSPRWQTIWVRSAEFANLRFPIQQLVEQVELPA